MPVSYTHLDVYKRQVLWKGPYGSMIQNFRTETYLDLKSHTTTIHRPISSLKNYKSVIKMYVQMTTIKLISVKSPIYKIVQMVHNMIYMVCKDKLSRDTKSHTQL